MNTAAPNSADKLETALARIFQLCEDRKLSARRYWWQEHENETQKTLI